MAFTESTAHKLLNHTFRNVAYTPPTKVYVGLFVAGVEISGKGYVRQEISFGAPSAGTIKNDVEVRFAIAEMDWGEVATAGIFDSLTGGSQLDQSAAAAVRVVRRNDQFIIPVGAYRIGVK